MIEILNNKDNVICTVKNYDELKHVLPKLRKEQTVYVELEDGSYEYPKIEE